MIDVAAFTGPWPWRPVGMGAAELAAHLRGLGIGRALVTPLEGIFWDDPTLANERLAGALTGIPLTLVPAVDPTFPSWRRDLEGALNRGTRAVRIFPGFRGFAMDHPACTELLELAGGEGLAVFVQLRMLDARMQSRQAPTPDVPLRAVLAAAAAAPSTSLVLGGARVGELRREAADLRKLGNVWVETSAVEAVDGLRSLVQLLGIERLLFGTHVPLFIARSAILKLEEAALDARQMRAYVDDNARRLLRE